MAVAAWGWARQSSLCPCAPALHAWTSATACLTCLLLPHHASLLPPATACLPPATASSCFFLCYCYTFIMPATACLTCLPPATACYCRPDVRMRLGLWGIASAGVAAALVWGMLAIQLGRQQQALAAGLATKEKEEAMRQVGTAIPTRSTTAGL